jgi:Mrp family chromosome partitioning ATPase
MMDNRTPVLKLDRKAEPDAASRAEGGQEPVDSGSVGELRFRDEGIVTPSKLVPIIESLQNHHSLVGEELRLLGASLLNLGRRRKVSCLAVTSALPGEGKSSVSLGLACALAREPGRRVLLVEADLRRPSITPTLGLPPAPGLTEWLNGALEEVPIRAVEPGGFFLLVAGQLGLERPEFLGSPRMAGLLQAARMRFDFVIVDAVPVLPAADAVLIQDLVDGFLFVVRSRQTPRGALHDGLARLRSDRVIGVVLNAHREYRGSYRQRAYRGYGIR